MRGRSTYTKPLRSLQQRSRVSIEIYYPNLSFGAYIKESSEKLVVSGGKKSLIIKIVVRLLSSTYVLQKAEVARLFIDSYPSKVMDVVDQLLRTCFEVEVDPFASKRTTSKRLAPMNRLFD